jgi:hypothetical protein
MFHPLGKSGKEAAKEAIKNLDELAKTTVDPFTKGALTIVGTMLKINSVQEDTATINIVDSDSNVLPSESSFNTVLYAEGRTDFINQILLSPPERIKLVTELCDVMNCTLRRRIFFGKYVLHLYGSRPRRHVVGEEIFHGYMGDPEQFNPEDVTDAPAPQPPTPTPKKEVSTSDVFDGDDLQSLHINYIYSLPHVIKGHSPISMFTLRMIDGGMITSSPQYDAIFKVLLDFILGRGQDSHRCIAGWQPGTRILR